MDVSQQLSDYAAQNSTAVLERATPIQVDAGLLAAFDTMPVDAAEYKSNLEPHLLALTLTTTQSLLASLFTLPTEPSEFGPVAKLPDAETVLPREKPLPKPKQLTKWERFANAKGISHKKKDRKVWDEERQDWVNRWGRDGKNKDSEDQWLHEIKSSQDPTSDPRAAARSERKERVAKNTRQHARNVAEASAKAAASPLSALGRDTAASGSQASKAASRALRKAELERSMLVSKTSTASLGRFDKKIEGEPRARGVKRKFDANVVTDFSGEKSQAMDVLHKLGTAERKKAPKKGGAGVEGGVNARKAMRYEARTKQLSQTRSKRK